MKGLQTEGFAHLRQYLPLLDQGISALVEDIYAQGLDHDVTVVIWGEFGRTPRSTSRLAAITGPGSSQRYFQAAA